MQNPLLNRSEGKNTSKLWARDAMSKPLSGRTAGREINYSMRTGDWLSGSGDEAAPPRRGGGLAVSNI
jgi:hypothetical protein